MVNTIRLTIDNQFKVNQIRSMNKMHLLIHSKDKSFSQKVCIFAFVTGQQFLMFIRVGDETRTVEIIHHNYKCTSIFQCDAHILARRTLVMLWMEWLMSVLLTVDVSLPLGNCDNIKILNCEDRDYPRLVQEAIQIRWRTTAEPLPGSWDSVLVPFIASTKGQLRSILSPIMADFSYLYTGDYMEYNVLIKSLYSAYTDFFS